MESDLKDFLKTRLLSAGASAVGFADAAPVDASYREAYNRWLQRGDSGALEYMSRNEDLRFDPRTLLPDAATVVSVAWNYLPSRLRSPDLPFIARYAYGRDYHKALRSLMKPICREAEDVFGCKWRICVDSAPMAERYWAVKSGVGFIGRNGALIVPGKGSWMFLSEILLTQKVEPDEELSLRCEDCGACLRACPCGALRDDATVDVRRCLSAATVEGTPLESDYHGEPHLLGCDRCQEVCPHNRGAMPSEWMKPIENVAALQGAELQSLDDDTFKSRFAGTCLMRPGRTRLKDNLNL